MPDTVRKALRVVRTRSSLHNPSEASIAESAEAVSDFRRELTSFGFIGSERSTERLLNYLTVSGQRPRVPRRLDQQSKRRHPARRFFPCRDGEELVDPEVRFGCN